MHKLQEILYALVHFSTKENSDLRIWVMKIKWPVGYKFFIYFMKLYRDSCDLLRYYKVTNYTVVTAGTFALICLLRSTYPLWPSNNPLKHITVVITSALSNTNEWEGQSRMKW